MALGNSGSGMTWGDALHQAVKQLRKAGIANAAIDARRLLAHAAAVDPGRISLMLTDRAEVGQVEPFLHLVHQRCQHQPVSQLIGSREFYGRMFRVTPDVLDPRPDTETLIDIALTQPFARILDLGTGSGCILLSLLAENPNASGVGVDVSSPALGIAAQNATSLGLQARADFLNSDWFEAVEGQFDLIVVNPPYISADEYRGLAPDVRNWEPKLALCPGGDGLNAYRAIAGGVVEHLATGGRLIVEIGPSQARAVQPLLQGAGLTDIAVHPDIDGRDRVVSGHMRRKKST